MTNTRREWSGTFTADPHCANGALIALIRDDGRYAVWAPCSEHEAIRFQMYGELPSMYREMLIDRMDRAAAAGWPDADA